RPPRSAAVLVGGRAGVETVGQQVDGRTVAGALHQLDAAALLGPRLGPGDRVTVERDATQAGGGPHDQLGGDGGRPRTVGRHGRRLPPCPRPFAVPPAGGCTANGRVGRRRGPRATADAPGPCDSVSVVCQTAPG